MTISFAPLRPDAVDFLMDRTGGDFRHCDFAAPNWFCATARDDDGKIQGVWVAEFQVWFEAHVTTAIDDPRFMSRRLLRVLFTTLFSRAVRVTAMARPDNHKSIEGIKRLGFRYEGFCRLGIEGRWDALVFGMLKNECKWLEKRPPLAKLDLANSRLGDAEARGDLPLPPRRLPDPTHLLSRQLGHLVMLAALVVGVAMPFSGVFPAGRPAEMARIDTSWITAAMSGIKALRGRPVSELADDPVSLSTGAIPTQLRIPASIFRQWPRQAAVTAEIQCLQEKVLRAHLLNIQEA